MQPKQSALYVLRILYFAMLIGIVVFTGVCFFLSQTSEAPLAEENLGKIFLYIAVGLGVVCVAAASTLMKKDLGQIQQLFSIAEKMEKYRAASIRSYALTEAPALFAIIAFFLTHNLQLLGVVGLLIVSFLIQFPSAKKVGMHIGESAEDVEKFQN